MFNRLGPIDLQCDSPPYIIVQATQRIGIQEPEDVRWSRLSHYLHEPPTWRELLSLRSLRSLLTKQYRGEAKGCVCGQPLPCMAKYTFTFNTGSEESYMLGQCDRCRTVFWEEP